MVITQTRKNNHLIHWTVLEKNFIFHAKTPHFVFLIKPWIIKASFERTFKGNKNEDFQPCRPFIRPTIESRKRPIIRP
jgi:hypothetical protein